MFWTKDWHMFLLNSQIQEKVAQNDRSERLSRLLKRCQSLKIVIKADILEFQEKSELEFLIGDLVGELDPYVEIAWAMRLIQFGLILNQKTC